MKFEELFNERINEILDNLLQSIINFTQGKTTIDEITYNCQVMLDAIRFYDDLQ